jgi:Clp amino terminal domain, pathogenicity island component
LGVRRFTDRARKVLVLAQDEARLLSHNFIGTEHILLGLLRETDGVAAKALESLDIRLDDARRKVAEIVEPGAGPPATVSGVPFTPRSKKVLELSLREALRLGHNYIGTEHILLGLVREGEGVGVRALVELGAEPARVTARVLELLPGRRAGAIAVGQERGTGPAVGDPPFCPYCQNTLAGSLRYASLRAMGTGSDDPAINVAFVYCGGCGRALGPAPAGGAGRGLASGGGGAAGSTSGGGAGGAGAGPAGPPGPAGPAGQG